MLTGKNSFLRALQLQTLSLHLPGFQSLRNSKERENVGNATFANVYLLCGNKRGMRNLRKDYISQIISQIEKILVAMAGTGIAF